ncbi:hypothetical protein NQ176_g2789 [Zarea fungicola]|uniref:Uncharacterized protein n=1 Tax=Zarea fungicola TaxID=93591 RepID=A0ACC1NML5_9HYPO|nr:hypothetical protein NQ176_g2789 [Lecanicillium fungicola]
MKTKSPLAWTAATVLAGVVFISPANAGDFFSALSRCPQPCSIAGPNSSNWTLYYDTAQLYRCNETVLFDLNIHNSISADSHIGIRACSASDLPAVKPILTRHISARQELSYNTSDSAGAKGQKAFSSKCGKGSVVTTDFHVGHWGAAVEKQTVSALASVVGKMVSYMGQEGVCNEQILFGMSGSTIVGIYKGSQIDQASATSLLAKFGRETTNEFGRTAAQICSGFGPSMFGVVADMTRDLAGVQKDIQHISQAGCLDGEKKSFWNNTSVDVLTAVDVSVVPVDKGLNERSIKERATCKYTQVQSGDGCFAIAARCGITQDNLQQFNPQSNFCSTLQLNQYVCCSSGSLPDFSPQPGKDGSCASYTVKAGDFCSAIATSHSTTVDRLESANKNTWGWNGCGSILVGQIMCLSNGTPPMPNPVANAICGPQVPGTKPPPKGTSLESLNPCPLNACCNVWGQCGITPSFCSIFRSTTGAPGTSQPGKNSCISNCGVSPVRSGPPAQRRRVGYFEAFSKSRPCMNMDITTIPDAYTDVHYAFAGITKDFQVDVSQYADVFAKFRTIKQRKVVSFGGWSFSTDADTFPIFRLGVTDSQRQQFASNVANFVSSNNLDGVDFDWEYPGAPDIPGIPPGDAGDGLRYLQFLKLIRSKLPSGKTLSIAAPASFWYLKGFPIKDISSVVDYIVYMTYDLHGQWDYGNTFVNEDCPNGNCLRSHVNLTETNYALAMITKAGVPQNKVLVGMGSYGRSFKMTDANCSGPECTFTGPASGATPGECTGEAGYISNFEIQSLISASINQQGHNVRLSKSNDGDVAIIDNKDWVSYLSDDSFNLRLQQFSGLSGDGWAGTVEWAIDLNSNSYTGEDIHDDDGEVDPLCDVSLKFNSINDIANGNYPLYCSAMYALQVLTAELDSANSEYNDVNNGYDALFGYYATYMKKVIPSELDAFMSGNGKNYFVCSESHTNNNATGDCGQLLDELKFENIFTLWWTLRDHDGFYNDLLNNHGIQADWVKFGDTEQRSSCGHNVNCDPENRKMHGFPLEADNVQVPNPKDIITKAGPNFSNVEDIVGMTLLDVLFAQWGGDLGDALNVASVPVSIVKEAVETMKEVKTIGETEKEEEQKELVVKILSVVFMVVPFVGEAGAAAAGLAQLGRIISIAGEVANTAISIYDVVSDPTSLPMAMFGIMMSGLGVARTEENFAKMGKLERDMDAAGTLAKLGQIISDDSSTMKKLSNQCLR